MQTELTLILIKEGDKILLGKKKYGFGMNKYNGYGGKTEPGENPFDAIKREVMEEAEIEVNEITKIGEITFFMNKKDVAGANSFNMHDELFVHVFIGRGIVGTPKETNEMIPYWFNANELPYDEMWSDDIYWMPFLLQEKPFKGYCKFGGDDVTIIEHSFEEVAPY
jgi:8-oxo-dGTP pyrophosphatase MutT (NUDIX family)